MRRHERHALTRLEPREHLGHAASLIVLVVGDEPLRRHSVPGDEDTRSSRVLAEHEVCSAKLRQHA